MLLSLPVDLLRSHVVGLLSLKDTVILEESLKSSLKTVKLIQHVIGNHVIVEPVLLNDCSAYWMHKHNMFPVDIRVGRLSEITTLGHFQRTKRITFDVRTADVSASVLKDIIIQCNVLESFKAHGTQDVITNDFCAVLIANCPSITELKFQCSKDFKVNMLVRLSLAYPNLSLLHLTCLQTISDAHLEKICYNCRHLVDLNLHACTSLSDTTLRSIVQYCSVWLTTLDISCLPLITDLGTAALFSALPNLTSIDISTCCGLNSSTFTALARSCPQLVHINLASNIVGNEALLEFAHNCPRLQHLNVSHARSVSATGLVAVAAGCKDLKSFFLNGCANATNATIQNIRLANPGIERFFLDYS